MVLLFFSKAAHIEHQSVQHLLQYIHRLI